jgi:hypothetical protein
MAGRPVRLKKAVNRVIVGAQVANPRTSIGAAVVAVEGAAHQTRGRTAGALDVNCHRRGADRSEEAAMRSVSEIEVRHLLRNHLWVAAQAARKPGVRPPQLPDQQGAKQ